MALTTNDHDPKPLGDGIEWMDLTPEIERVRPRRTRWTALLIAGFAAVTGLGLAATNVMPHLTDRGSERRDVGSALSASPTAEGSRQVDDQLAAAATAATDTVPNAPVAATNRVELSNGLAHVFVAGASVTTGTRITVSFSVAGRTVATANPTPAVVEGAKDSLAPWSAVLEVPLGDWPDDAVATVTVAWLDASGDGGSLSSTVVLGDGRVPSGWGGGAH